RSARGNAIRALTSGRLPEEEAARWRDRSVAERYLIGTDRREVEDAVVLAAEVDLRGGADRRPPVGELALIGLDRQRPCRPPSGGGAVDRHAAIPAKGVEATD